MDHPNRNQSAADSRPSNERDVLVPVIDEAHDGVVYDRSLTTYALVGALAGAVLGGWLGWALSVGAIAVTGLGQWAASGAAVGIFTGLGVGASVFGLLGALVALYRLNARPPMKM